MERETLAVSHFMFSRLNQESTTSTLTKDVVSSKSIMGDKALDLTAKECAGTVRQRDKCTDSQ